MHKAHRTINPKLCINVYLQISSLKFRNKLSTLHVLSFIYFVSRRKLDAFFVCVCVCYIDLKNIINY